MSIADKLTYLQTTKQLLKTEINKINNVLDDNSTFRSYPQELFNGYLDILNNGTDTLWSNLEKVSQTGTEAVLEGVETAPMKVELQGNTSQETTTGKNLFTTDYLTSNSFTTYTKLTDNSFSFTATGTWKKASYKAPCKPNTNYYFNFSSTSSMYIQIRGVQTGTQIIAVYQAYLTTFNSGENTELQINIDTGQNSIASGTISDIQLEEGTTATSFEKYTGGQPSPSPDYPQDVNVVSGNNNIVVCGKNLFDKDNITLNKYIDGSGNIQNENGNFICEYISIDNTKDYYLSSNATSIKRICYYDKTKTFISREISYNQILKLTIPNNTKYVILSCASDNLDTLQLEQGNQATTYEAYTGATYPINLGSIELCKIGDYQDYLYKNNGKWYLHKEIGKVVLDGSESWNVSNTGTPNYIYYAYINNFKPLAKGGYSNYYTFIGIGGSDTNQGIFAVSDYVRIRYGTEDTVANFKTWLSTHNVAVYYPLATPTEEEITDTSLIAQLEAIAKAKSVKDKTYITQTNEELPFILDVEAIKEYEVN